MRMGDLDHSANVKMGHIEHLANENWNILTLLLMRIGDIDLFSQ